MTEADKGLPDESILSLICQIESGLSKMEIPVKKNTGFSFQFFLSLLTLLADIEMENSMNELESQTKQKNFFLIFCVWKSFCNSHTYNTVNFIL